MTGSCIWSVSKYSELTFKSNSNIKTKSSRQSLKISYMERSNFCMGEVTLVWGEVTSIMGRNDWGRNDHGAK